jgi:N-methylhydantoinase B
VTEARHDVRALDPVTLSVFVSALAGIAEEMGAILIRSSYSSNIKERRDCSCALFNEAGRMVAQAEHIPVHLGAMVDSVRAVRERDPQPGDVFVVNDPYDGGTHLPDITLVAPVDVDGEIVGYTVSRAHHSDVGGMTPGSMPSESRSIYAEGIVIPPLRLVRGGVLVEDLLELILANVRTPEIRRVDLLAQTAANEVGAERLRALVERHGLDFVRTAFDEVIAYGERRTRDVLRSIPDGTYTAEGVIEGDGVVDVDIPIRVAVTIDGDAMRADFAGTAPPVAGNVNCPISVTRSACLFALRVLLPGDVPTNAGTAAPLEVRVPEPSLADARRPMAVVAGNVETSQRLADIVLEALGRAVDLPAAGQGTMNNLIIGGADWTYYETIGGGQGASSAGPGPSGVHVGMSNTLNTPIESLELEFPMRVERYELRYGSGGDGRHRGGDGIDRRVRVLEPATLSLLTDRRRHGPAGKDGGLAGACGENLLDGTPLPPKRTCDLAPGQIVSVLTPGGGGFGAPGEG